MINLTITTLKGATVTLRTGEEGGTVGAYVNGKPHTTLGVKLGRNPELGDYLELAGNAKAQVNESDVIAVKAFFVDAAARFEAYKRSYVLSDSERSAALTAKMSGRYSAL